MTKLIDPILSIGVENIYKYTNVQANNQVHAYSSNRVRMHSNRA